MAEINCLQNYTEVILVLLNWRRGAQFRSNQIN